MSNKPTLSRRRFVAATSSLAVLLAGCTETSGTPSGDQTTATTSTTSVDDQPDSSTKATEETSEENEAKSKAVTVGETVADDQMALVIRSVATTESLGEFTTAEEGNEFVVVRMAAKNQSSQYVEFNSFWQSRLKDSENHVYSESLDSTDHPLQSGVLVPGEVARGDAVYEVPKTATGRKLQFDFSTFDLFEFDRVIVDLTEKANDIANLDQGLNVAVNAVGDQVENDGVAVTVHGVERATKLGQFTSAEDGSEYVIPEIEVTNNRSEPLTVSTLLQMRVKTDSGLAYMGDLGGTAELDQAYSEGSDIAPGASRRGKLAYQVDKEEEQLYWTFNFLDIEQAKKAFWSL